MKRIHLFEFKDLSWFPQWIRIRLTRLVQVQHQILDSETAIVKLLKPVIEESKVNIISDFGSGNGGIIQDVVYRLVYHEGFEHLTLTLTDMYPNMISAKKFQPIKHISYYTRPVDIRKHNPNFKGLRNLICGFHRIKPEDAKQVLKSAAEDKVPIFIYELSDNRLPKYLWWITLPFHFVACFFITTRVQELSWQQILFTYIIPILPFFYAWDSAVANARTYTLKDLDELLEGLETPNYKWTKGNTGKKMKQIYLYGEAV